MSFSEWFVEETNVAFYFLPVDADFEFAQQLVEVEFDGVPFQFSHFETEFHNYLPAFSKIIATPNNPLLRSNPEGCHTIVKGKQPKPVPIGLPPLHANETGILNQKMSAVGVSTGSVEGSMKS
jgi:hypothetical protein